MNSRTKRTLPAAIYVWLVPSDKRKREKDRALARILEQQRKRRWPLRFRATRSPYDLTGLKEYPGE